MKYKRMTALLTAAIILLCGCQSAPKIDPALGEQTESVQTDEAGNAVPLADDALTTRVKAETVTAPDGIWGLEYEVTVADGVSIPGMDHNLLHYSLKTSKWTETALTPFASYAGYYDAGGLVDVGENAIYRLAVMENHNNMNPADGGDTDYDFWEQYSSSCESDYWLCTYNTDGTLTGKMQVTGLEAYPDEYGNPQPFSFLWDHEGIFLTLQNGMILRVEEDGSVTKTEDAPVPEEGVRSDGVMRRFLRDRDGKVLICDVTEQSTPSNDAMTYAQTVREFDLKTGKLGEVLYTGDEPFTGMNSRTVSGGCGDYRLFVNNANVLLGIRDDGTTETVIDWAASDLEPMTVAVLPDGSFLGFNYSEGENGTWYRLTRLHKSEIGEPQKLTLAVLERDYAVKDFVKSFNRSHSNIRISTITYTDSGDQTALDKLKMSIVSDDAPDLVLMYDAHEQFLKFGSKGVFADLNGYLDKDAELSREMLVPNVLTSMQHPDGSLYALPSGFVVETIAVKTKFTDQESWTVDDMLDLYEGADDIFYYWSTKEDALNMFLIGTDFTDELAGTCSFDSPEFVKILEFCNRYPMESTLPEKNYEDEAQYAKFENWYYENFMKYQRDQDYLYPFAISAPGGGLALSQWSYVKAELGGDMTLTGYPSNNGQGGKITTEASRYTQCGEMGIVSTSQNSDAAWEVLKAYVEDGKEYNERPAFSLIDTKFEEQLDGMMYVWSDDKPTDTPYYEDDGNNVYPLTQEERDDLERYIRGCDTFMMLDGTVKNIVLEEAGMFFAGDQTAEAAAKKIQSRAELYLSEQN